MNPYETQLKLISQRNLLCGFNPQVAKPKLFLLGLMVLCADLGELCSLCSEGKCFFLHFSTKLTLPLQGKKGHFRRWSIWHLFFSGLWFPRDSALLLGEWGTLRTVACPWNLLAVWTFLQSSCLLCCGGFPAFSPLLEGPASPNP